MHVTAVNPRAKLLLQRATTKNESREFLLSLNIYVIETFCLMNQNKICFSIPVHFIDILVLFGIRASELQTTTSLCFILYLCFQGQNKFPFHYDRW
jgi:hypothetical protein